MKHIHKCSRCSKFTMNEVCSCGSVALIAKPIKFAMDDHLGLYRRKAKMNEYIARGLL